MGRLLNIWRSWSVAPPACAGRRAWSRSSPGRRSPHTWSRGARPTSRIPTAAFHKQKRVNKKPETLNWPMYGYDPARTRYLPVKGLDPPFGASLWSFQAGKLLEFQPIVVHGTHLLHGQGRDLLRAQRPRRAHRVEAQDRHAQRVLPRLLERQALRGQPRAAAGGGARTPRRKARCSGVPRCPAAASPRRSSTMARSSSAASRATSSPSTQRPARCAGRSTPAAR